MGSTSPTQAFTGGKFHDAVSGQTFDTIEPATGKVLAAVSACGPEDVDQAVAAARAAFEGGRWSRLALEDEAEAIRIANDTTYGLAASVFTHDLDAAQRLARAVRAGTVTVNCYGEGDITTPFGGYKGSGFGGKDKGLEAFEQYTEQKTIWIALNSRPGR